MPFLIGLYKLNILIGLHKPQPILIGLYKPHPILLGLYIPITILT